MCNRLVQGACRRRATEGLVPVGGSAPGSLGLTGQQCSPKAPSKEQAKHKKKHNGQDECGRGAGAGIAEGKNSPLLGWEKKEGVVSGEWMRGKNEQPTS